jgi:hypothetical protein
MLAQTQLALAAMLPKETLTKADQARGNAEGMQWEIKITAVEDGRKSSQTIEVKTRGFNALSLTLSPARVKGRRLLMVDQNMWFVRPGLRKPVPISPRQRLIGAASNGDIASTNYAEEYEVEQMPEDVIDGDPCYLFDLKAIDKRATYDRIKYWISKARLVGVRAEFFTVSGKMLKSATFAYDNSIEIEGRRQPFISRMVITDAVNKSNVTTMTYSNAEVKKIPDSTFNLNLLLR